MKNVSITCSHCNGSGTVDLPRYLHATLALVRKKPRQTRKAYQHGSMSLEAVNVHLSRLHALGFVRKAGTEGRFTRWEAVEQS